MVRNIERDDSIVRHGQARRGVPTSMHGQLAVDMGSIPCFGLSPASDAVIPFIHIIL